MTVEALNCPNCGAGVASDSTQCEFCKSRLKTMACPSCFGLMFVGSKFCGHCGAKAVQAEAADGDNLGECPRCRRRLDSLQIGDVTLSECKKCSGMWADVETFQNICVDREKQSSVLGFIGDRELNAEPLSKISYVPCPKCKQLMNRSNFAKASGVIIDTCKQHGVWFDAEELPKVIEFIQKGGMDIARQRERMEIENERGRLREDLRRQAKFDAKFGTANISDRDDDRGVQGFLSKLFDI
ncbi:MAG: zf-TFIIB domain-containing protein [Chloracidobacterium sp.]|nr:zf-TFIIB domain-containing protein [Chloracidobacterium sp.]